MSEFRVVAVEAPALYDLRRRILRRNDPKAVVEVAGDHEATSHHFAGVLGERVVASASFYAAPSPIRAELSSYQLRFMAVDADVQGRGYGTAVLEVAERTLAELGVRQLWANARDSALGFYEATGWSRVEGSEHVSVVTGLPHTAVVKLLEPPLT